MTDYDSLDTLELSGMIFKAKQQLYREKLILNIIRFKTLCMIDISLFIVYIFLYFYLNKNYLWFIYLILTNYLIISLTLYYIIYLFDKNITSKYITSKYNHCYHNIYIILYIIFNILRNINFFDCREKYATILLVYNLFYTIFCLIYIAFLFYFLRIYNEIIISY